MFRNFLKVALRSIRKRKLNTIISILGLTVGLTVFILMITYIRFELSFNKFHSNYNNIYRVETKWLLESGEELWATTPYPMSAGLKKDFPEVEAAVKINGVYEVFEANNKSNFENNGYYVDSSFFDIFSVDFVKGNSRLAFKDPHSIIVTESFAKKYYADSIDLGMLFLLDHKISLKVCGVIKDFPANSDMQPDFILPFELFDTKYKRDRSQRWGSHMVNTFILLKENKDLEQFKNKIKNYLNEKTADSNREVLLLPLSKLHLEPSGGKKLTNMLLLYGLIAILILIVATFNYINLYTADAVTRIKEAGIKQIIGSSRRALIMQHIGESLLIAFIAFDISILIAERILPLYNSVMQSNIPYSLFYNIPFLCSMLLVALANGFVAGMFPALQLAAIKPFHALKNGSCKLGRGAYLRKGLIVIQYCVALILIVSTIVVLNQFNYTKNKDLGFNSKGLIICPLEVNNMDDTRKVNAIKNELNKLAGIKASAITNWMAYFGTSSSLYGPYMGSGENAHFMLQFRAENDFFNTMEVPIVEGENFENKHHESDLGVCLINKTAVNTLGWDKPVGKVLFSDTMKYKVIGVYDDFHCESLSEVIKPQIMLPLLYENNRYYTYLISNYEGKDIKQIEEKANELKDKFMPKNPYRFFIYGLGGLNNNVLKTIKGVEKSFGFFTIITIIISCLGIFGLIALTMKQRTKEIGIRKVLGSSVNSIFKMISKEYLTLILIANIIALPLAWVVSEKILQNYTYRTSISVDAFVIAFLLSLAMTFITILYHALRAAHANPVKAIKYE